MELCLINFYYTYHYMSVTKIYSCAFYAKSYTSVAIYICFYDISSLGNNNHFNCNSNKASKKDPLS